MLMLNDVLSMYPEYGEENLNTSYVNVKQKYYLQIEMN